MEDILKIEILNDEPVIDSRIVAEVLKINHSDWARKVLKKHLEAFSDLKPEKELTGGRSQVYYWLTEEQALFTATLSRNNQHVVAFKRKLVQSFIAARRAFQQLASKPMSAIDILELSVKQLRQHEEAIALIKGRHIEQKVNTQLDQEKKKAEDATSLAAKAQIAWAREYCRREDREENSKMYRRW